MLCLSILHFKINSYWYIGRELTCVYISCMQLFLSSLISFEKKLVDSLCLAGGPGVAVCCFLEAYHGSFWIHF